MNKDLAGRLQKLILLLILYNFSIFTPIMCMTQEDALTILGFEKGAQPTFEEIKKLYKKKARVTHPDKTSADPEAKTAAEEAFKNLSEAYTFLNKLYNGIDINPIGKQAEDNRSPEDRGFYLYVYQDLLNVIADMKENKQDESHNLLNEMEKTLTNSKYAETLITKKFLYLINKLSDALPAKSMSSSSGMTVKEEFFQQDKEKLKSGIDTAESLKDIASLSGLRYEPAGWFTFYPHLLPGFLQFIDPEIRTLYIHKVIHLLESSSQLNDQEEYIKQILAQLSEWTGFFAIDKKLMENLNTLLIKKKYLVEYLTQIGEEKNELRKKSFLASFEKHIEQLDKDTLNVQDGDGRTLIMVAAKYNFIDLMKKLIARGADINKQDRWMLTPLWKAAIYNKKEAIELLLQNKADLSLGNSSFVGSAPKNMNFIEYYSYWNLTAKPDLLQSFFHALKINYNYAPSSQLNAYSETLIEKIIERLGYVPEDEKSNFPKNVTMILSNMPEYMTKTMKIYNHTSKVDEDIYPLQLLVNKYAGLVKEYARLKQDMKDVTKKDYANIMEIFIQNGAAVDVKMMDDEANKTIKDFITKDDFLSKQDIIGASSAQAQAKEDADAAQAKTKADAAQAKAKESVSTPNLLVTTLTQYAQALGTLTKVLAGKK